MLFDQRTNTFPLASDDNGQIEVQITIVDGAFSLRFSAQYPNSLSFQELEAGDDIGYPGNGGMKRCPNGCLYDGGGDGGCPILGDDDPMNAEGICRSNQSPEILRILDSIDDEEKGPFPCCLLPLDHVGEVSVFEFTHVGQNTLMRRGLGHTG